jgi:GMP synthase (glutamine-hydrolysing)
VTLNPAGRTDDLLGAAPPGARAVQWNDDVVAELPPGATPLAFAPDGSVQAARYGALAWGVQFHPECTPEILAAWAAPDSERDGPQRDVAARAVAEVAAAREELQATWRPLAARLARFVRRSAAARVP